MNGGEIKNVLTLDVSKFESAVKKATGQLENLDAKLDKAERIANKLEKGVKSLSAEMGSVAGGFQILESVVGKVNKRLDSAQGSVKGVGTASKRAAKDLEKLAGAGEKLETLADWTAHYGKSLKALNPQINATAKSHTTLDKALSKYAKNSKQSEEDIAAARAKTLAKERQTNQAMIASRRTMIEELRRIESNAQAKAQSETAVARKYFGPNINSPKRMAALQNATSAREEAAQAAEQRRNIEGVVTALANRNAQLRQGIVSSMREVQSLRELEALDRARLEHRRKMNAEEKKGKQEQAALDKRVNSIMSGATLPGNSAAASAQFFAKKADEEIKQARRAERERIRAARHAATIERQEALATAQVWRGIGAMWATSKMAQAGSSGINAASEYQRADVRLKLYNMPEAEYEQFKKSSKSLVNQTPGLSMEDALLLRMDGMSALGHNDPDVLDALMPKASKAALGLKAAGYDKSDTSTIMKNLFGIIEMRQQQYDPEAAKRTIDVVTQAAIASNGKITLQDIETYFRNGGSGARQMTDDGLRNIIPLMEMFKTAGGGSGGGSGIARVGTMTKMLQAYANGKPLTNTGVQQMLGAGTLNAEFDTMTVENFKRTEKANIALMKALKSNGLKDSDLLMDDPVAFLRKLRDPVLSYMNSKENRSKFFNGYEDFSYNDKGEMVRAKDGKVVDQVNQANIEGAAFQKFFNSMGLSQGAIDGMTTAMNIIAQQRAVHVSEQQKTAGGADDIYSKSMNTWKGSVDKLTASGKNLAVALMPVLDGMSALVDVLNVGVKAVGDFIGGSGFGQVAGVMAASVIGVAAFNMTIGNAFRAMAGAKKGLDSLKAIEAGVKGVASASPLLETLGTSVAGVGTKAAGAKTGIGGLGTVVADTGKKTGGMLDGFTKSGAAMKGATALSAGLQVGLSALGGPLGLIATLLIGGVSLWANWGSAARNAIHDAEKGIADADGELNRIRNEKKFGVGRDADAKARLEAAEKAYKKARDEEVALASHAHMAKETRRLSERSRAETYGQKVVGPARFQKFDANNVPLSDVTRKMYEEVGKWNTVVLEQKDLSAPKVTLGKKGHENTTTVSPSDLNKPVKPAREPRQAREFQDSFQIKLSQFEQDAKMLQLETSGLMRGNANYDERAREQFIKAWMTGQFDNGKDPQHRPFANKAYDKKRGWSAEDIDFDGDKQRSYMDAVKAKLEAEDVNAAVSMGKSKLEAASEDVASALATLATEAYGGSEAMDAMRREFARFEAKNPGAVGNADYSSMKREAMTSAAAKDALNLASTFKQGSFEKKLQYSGKSDYEKRVLSAQHTADLEEKRMKVAEDNLRNQIAEEEKKGNTSSTTYKNALAALAEIEGSYGEQRKILNAMVNDAKKSAVQRQFDTWEKLSDQYDSLASSWQSNISNTLKGALAGKDSIDIRAFGATVAGDLAGMFMNKSLSTMNTGLFGGTSFFDQVQSLMGGTGIADGGWLGDKLNQWRGLDKEGNGTAAGFGETVSSMFQDLTSSLGSFGEGLRGAIGGLGNLGSSLFDGVKSVGEFSWSLIEQAVDAIGQFVSSLMSMGSSGGGGIGGLIGGIGGMLGLGGVAGGATGSGVMGVLGELGVFANGGSFGKGGLHAFAKGGAFTNGVYSSPTLFKFAKGGGFNNGVMGEAGPEAVMPLSRDGSGRLGVAVHGGDASGVNVEININVAQDGSSTTTSTGSDAETWKKMAGQVKGLVVQEIVNQKRPGGTLYTK